MQYLVKNIFTVLPLAFVLAVIGGVTVAIVLTSDEGIQSNSNTAQDESTIVAGDFLTVHDQDTNGFVNVSQVSLSRSGFLLLQEANSNGDPAEVLAVSSYLSEGTHENVEISFSKEQRITADSFLFVSLVHDMDEDGVYSDIDLTDSPRDNSGWPLRAVFVPAIN